MYITAAVFSSVCTFPPTTTHDRLVWHVYGQHTHSVQFRLKLLRLSLFQIVRMFRLQNMSCKTEWISVQSAMLPMHVQNFNRRLMCWHITKLYTGLGNYFLHVGEREKNPSCTELICKSNNISIDFLWLSENMGKRKQKMEDKTHISSQKVAKRKTQSSFVRSSSGTYKVGTDQQREF